MRRSRCSLTPASGAADPDTLMMFEGHAIPGIREEYVEEREVHRLQPIAATAEEAERNRVGSLN